VLGALIKNLVEGSTNDGMLSRSIFDRSLNSYFILVVRLLVVYLKTNQPEGVHAK